jgi:hypothetical protein
MAASIPTDRRVTVRGGTSASNLGWECSREARESGTIGLGTCTFVKGSSLEADQAGPFQPAERAPHFRAWLSMVVGDYPWHKRPADTSPYALVDNQGRTQEHSASH